MLNVCRIHEDSKYVQLEVRKYSWIYFYSLDYLVCVLCKDNLSTGRCIQSW